MIWTITGRVLYADGINVNVLVVMLYNSFARCHHSGNWGKDTWDLFWSHHSYNGMWIYNELRVRNLTKNVKSIDFIFFLIRKRMRSYVSESLPLGSSESVTFIFFFCIIWLFLQWTLIVLVIKKEDIGCKEKN